MNVETIRNFLLPIPPRKEQEAISDHISHELQRMLRTADRITHAISLLQEYRTSLISHAVTGKIDVRDKVEVPA